MAHGRNKDDETPMPQTANCPRMASALLPARSTRVTIRLRAARLASATLVAALGATGLTAACGGGQSEARTTGKFKVWALRDAQNEPVVANGIKSFNSASDIDAELVTYVNDAYKQKLTDAIGTADGPDVFFNWGGGNLARFVRSGQVADLTEALKANVTASSAFLPSVLDVGKVNGRQYGLPMNGIQPVVLFYNKRVFSDAGLAPPKTFDDLLSLVEAFKRRQITPIGLAGSQSWTELMYLEYLVDRIGGPEKFAAIASGAPGAWRDPALAQALRMCQDLAKRGAFGSSFASGNYDNTSISKLLAEGSTAMMLMGSWEYATQASNNPLFVKRGDLGWVSFPTVSGGAGDPANVVGNPSNYFSVSATSRHRSAASDFVVSMMASNEYVDALIEAGQVPAVRGAEKALESSPNAAFATFTYQLVARAPAFTQSWDQTLSPNVGTALLANLGRLFQQEITPERFVSAMEAAAAAG